MNSQNIELYIDMSLVYEMFFEITGLDYSLKGISKQHFFYDALKYFVDNRNNLTTEVQKVLGVQYYDTTNHLLNLLNWSLKAVYS